MRQQSRHPPLSDDLRVPRRHSNERGCGWPERAEAGRCLGEVAFLLVDGTGKEGSQEPTIGDVWMY